MIEAYLDGDIAGALALHRRLLPVFLGFFRTQGVILTKAALRLAGLPGGPVRSPLVEATADEVAQPRSDLDEAGWLSRSGRIAEPSGSRPSASPPPLPAGGLRVVALGGLGEIGRNMTVLRVRRSAARRRLRRAVPRGGSARRRPDPARLHLDPRPARRHRGDRPHPRPRGPHRRRAVPAARATDIPLIGPRFTLALVEAKLQEHRIDPYTLEVREGQTRAARAVRLRVPRRQPLHPGRAGGGDHDRRAGLLLHTGDFKMDQLPLDGRLTDWAASRGWGRRASTSCCPTPPTQRSPASSRRSARSGRYSVRWSADARRR